MFYLLLLDARDMIDSVTSMHENEEAGKWAFCRFLCSQGHQVQDNDPLR